MNDVNLGSLLSSLGIAKLRRRNSNWVGCCPSHQEQRPSWGITLKEPYVHGCFSCGFKGTLRSLLQYHFKWDATDVNNLLGAPDKEGRVKDDAFILPDAKPVSTEPPAVPEFHLYPYTLKTQAVEYLETRRIRRIRRQPTAVFANLLYDHADNRLLFPWYKNGVLIGATGRTLSTDPAVPKIIAYFGLRKGLYFYVPSRKLVADQPLILVEGETDALRVLQAGFTNVAALSFGRFSDTQFKTLVELSPENVVLFFDDDTVGKRLTADVSAVLREHLQVCSVNYSTLKKCDYKRDPADLTEPQVRFLIRMALANSKGYAAQVNRSAFELVG